MDSPSQQPSIADIKERARTAAQEELQGVLKALKEARKCLRRDWQHLAPRERSTQSRTVKQLEEQTRLLEEEIEMNRSG